MDRGVDRGARGGQGQDRRYQESGEVGGLRDQRLKRRVHGRAWAALRALLPAWRFFDRAEALPRLWCRASGPDLRWGDWEPLLGPAPRARFRLLHNAQGNLALAYHTLLQQLVAELAELDGDADGPTPEQLVSYELVVNLVRTLLAGRDDARHFQFKLTVDERAADAAQASEPEQLVLSRVHELGEAR